MISAINNSEKIFTQYRKKTGILLPWRLFKNAAEKKICITQIRRSKNEHFTIKEEINNIDASIEIGKWIIRIKQRIKRGMIENYIKKIKYYQELYKELNAYRLNFVICN
jgi:hypothetical protein